MCQFCVEHGEGKRWYLQAQNYALDLNSDIERREYVSGFISGFRKMREQAIAGGNVLNSLPQPIARLGRSAITRHQQKNHFGQPLPIEDCEKVLDIASSITAIPCICRMHQPGREAEPVCLLVTSTPVDSVLVDGFKDYENGPDLDDFNVLGKDEALALIRSCEEHGLMHSIWTFKTPFTAAICNCNIESGCLAMKMTVKYDLKTMWRGEEVATFDAERCSGCNQCVKQCPFEAIAAAGRSPVVFSADRCWGCGICRAACPSDAITMTDRSIVPAVAHLW